MKSRRYFRTERAVDGEAGVLGTVLLWALGQGKRQLQGAHVSTRLTVPRIQSALGSSFSLSAVLGAEPRASYVPASTPPRSCIRSLEPKVLLPGLATAPDESA